MNDCLFCKIVSGDMPSAKVYEDDQVLAFHDIDKKAPVHVLIVPKKHITSVAGASDADLDICTHIMRTAKKLAADFKLTDGFRIVVNTGKDGGQTVDHLHFHLLGGRSLTWPPG
ncbi:MAG: histidine triad nucleotide-binding protein [Eubacteriales bacterium]|nr:histidine triad nucleotide-binding protein [Eubacteriales bacterium]